MLLVDPHMTGVAAGDYTKQPARGRRRGNDSALPHEGRRGDYEVLDKRGPLHVVRQPIPWSLTAGFAERLTDVLTSLLRCR